MIGKKGKWRQQPEMEGWKNTKIKQGKKEGLRGGMTMKRLPSKDVKRKSRKNEHFQIFKFLIFGGFISVLCPTPTPWRLYTRLTRHKMLHYNVAPHTHTHHHLPGNWFYRVGQRETSPPRLLGFLFPSPKVRERTWAGRSIIQRFIKKKIKKKKNRRADCPTHST
jgi:hypothetical protein